MVWKWKTIRASSVMSAVIRLDANQARSNATVLNDGNPADTNTTGRALPQLGVPRDVLLGLFLASFAFPAVGIVLAVMMATGSGDIAERNLFIACFASGAVSLLAFSALTFCVCWNWFRHRRCLGYIVYCGLVLLLAAASVIGSLS